MSASTATAASSSGSPSPASLPLPPGPRGLPLVGVLPSFLRDLYGYFPQLARQYGDVVTVPMPGQKMVLVSHPDHVMHVVSRNQDNYWHTLEELRDALLPGDPPAIVIREGDDWKRARRVLNPRFNEGSLAGVSELIGEAIADGISSWDDFADTGEPVELQDEFGIVIMSALLRSMFSRHFSREHILELVQQFGVHGHFIINGLLTRLGLGSVPQPARAWISPNKLPWPHLVTGKANYGKLKRHVDELIAEHRQRTEESDDLLDLMLSARFEDGSGFTDAELRSELMGVLFAGFDTTAYALSWTIGLLAKNPDVLEKARAQVDALQGEPITYEQIAQLPYLRACFDEAQRLQGAPMNVRVAKKDDVIGGYRIPAGTVVLHSYYSLHRDPRFWTDPEAYNPDRFETDEIDKYAFIPFGAGPRRCMGMRMAYIEGILALANVLQRYDFEVPADWEPEHKWALATGLKSLPVTLRRRHQP